MHRTPRFRALVAACAVVVAGSLTLPVATSMAPAAADTLPEPVRADVLPAPQVNGVVWKLAIAGDTAFAGGQFTEARPFGVAAGGPGAITNGNPDPNVKLNLIAFDITTGALNTSFVPEFNGQINDMAVTPDETKLVVVGSFTKVNGVTRNRVAVFDLPSLTLDDTVKPGTDAVVYGVTATNSTIWIGGIFSSITGPGPGALPTPRSRLGSFSATTGELTSLQIPVENGRVNSVVVSPDGTQIAFGGSFTSVGGSSAPGYGLYRADAVTGAGKPLPVNAIIRNAGDNSAILSMASDGTSFYGAGYNFHGVAGAAGGTSEGVFQASWSDGALVTLEDCHGDSYGVAPVDGIVYVASHHHNCTNSGGFPQTQPNWTLWHATRRPAAVLPPVHRRQCHRSGTGDLDRGGQLPVRALRR